MTPEEFGAIAAAGFIKGITDSAYERIVAKRRAACRRCYDGAACVLEPLHADWHADAIGRRWP